ncbi:MAG: hypothetical protein HFJ10_02630 [Lachnospiraceae bacterium]|nr:hypothetical protein [Lachnospiraceae bacterium]
MLDKVQRWAVLLFSVVFAGIWCCVIFLSLVSFSESKKIGVLAVALCVLLIAGIFLAKKLLYKLWQQERFWLICSAVLLLVMAAGLFYTGMSLRVYPGWDFGSVYQGAIEIVENGALSEDSNWYFTTYPNNVAVCLFLAGVFKLFGGICPYITLGVIVNVVLLMAGMVFFFLLVRRLYGFPRAFLALVLCALFLPFYMHAPIFYTDTFALPFVTGTFLLYELRKKDCRFLLPAAFVLGMGYKMKGSLGVILVALLIHIWLQKDSFKEYVKKSAMLIVPFLLTVTLLTIVPRNILIKNPADVERNEFPVEHWLAMGLEGSGGYNFDVYFMTAAVEGKEAKKAVDREFIQKKLKEYGVSGMIAHLKDKIIITWGDGVYFAPEKLMREPVKESKLHSWVLYDGVNYEKTYKYCNAVQFLLLGGILLSLLRNLLEKGSQREMIAFQLAVFGVFLFLLLWETRSRYLVNFVPVFILLGMDGLELTIRRLQR